jgi:site-specific DNA recombinase
VTNLGVIRLSEVRGTAQTGPVRQRQEITQRFTQLGVPESDITWAEDLDVSAFHVPPLKRPGLRRALDALTPGSTIVFYRLDRFVRRTFPDWSDMVKFAAGHGHTLISATEPLNLDGAMGQMMATNLAFVAQLESENTSKRVVNTQNHLRRVGRWTGGPVLYGYAPIQVPGKPGWYLGLDESADVLRDAINKVLGGLAPNHVVGLLNDQDVMTPLDRARVIQDKLKPEQRRGRLCQCGHDEHEEPCGKLHKCHHRKRVDGKYKKLHDFDECSQPCPKFRPRRWVRASLVEILRSPALMGYTVEHDAVLRDDQGMPVRFAPGVVDEKIFGQLQEVLDGKAKAKTRTMTESLLLGVAQCNCQKPLYRNSKAGRRKSGKDYEYTYYTPKLPCECGSRKIPAEILDRMVARALLSEVGSFEVLRRVVTQAAGNDAELRQVGQQIAELTQDQFVRGKPRDDYAELMAKLQARHAELSAMPKEKPEERLVGTGQTFRQRWGDMGTVERRLWLLDAGVRVIGVKGVDPVWTMPAGPLTAEDIPRFIIDDQDDIHVRIMLGGLADLLRRVSAA